MTQPRERFVIVRNFFSRSVILRDIEFWADHEQELDQWCRDHGVRRQGMAVDMDDTTLSLFVLRWS